MLMADWDYLLDAPDNSTLYCLTDQHVRALLVVAEYLGWPSRYYSEIGTPINRDDVDALRAGVINALMTDKCTELLTKIQEVKDKVDHIETMITTLETNLDVSQTAQDVALAGILSELTGIVEPSIAGVAAAIAGVSLQVTGVQSAVDEVDEDVDNIETIVIATEGQVDNVYNTTNVNVTIINQATITYEQQVIDDGKAGGWKLPDSTYGIDSADSTGPTQYARWWALENACLRWIKTILYRVTATYDPTSVNLTQLFNDLVAAGGVVIGAVLRPSLGGLGYTIAQVQTAALDVPAAINVACTLANILYNQPANHLSLTTALTALGGMFTVGSDEYIISAVIFAADQADLLTGSEYNYNSLLSILWVTWQKYNLTANSWTTPDGCTLNQVGACPVAPYVQDFTLGKGDWIIHRGRWVPGVGIVGTTHPQDPYNYCYDVELLLPTGGCGYFTRSWKTTSQSFPGGNTLWRMEYYLSPGGAVAANLQPLSGGMDVISIPFNNTLYDKVRFYNADGSAYFPGVNPAYTSTYAVLKKIEVTNP